MTPMYSRVRWPRRSNGTPRASNSSASHPTPTPRMNLPPLSDGQRLKQFDVAVDQGRHHHLRIDRSVFGGELVALFEVQKTVLPCNALQVQRDTHAEARLRAIILNPGVASWRAGNLRT